jgi:hypothetical protein
MNLQQKSRDELVKLARDVWPNYRAGSVDTDALIDDVREGHRERMAKIITDLPGKVMFDLCGLEDHAEYRRLWIEFVQKSGEIYLTVQDAYAAFWESLPVR